MCTSAIRQVWPQLLALIHQRALPSLLLWSIPPPNLILTSLIQLCHTLLLDSASVLYQPTAQHAYRFLKLFLIPEAGHRVRHSRSKKPFRNLYVRARHEHRQAEFRRELHGLCATLPAPSRFFPKMYNRISPNLTMPDPIGRTQIRVPESL